MSTETQKKPPGPPPIVRLEKALNLAEQWVNTMTKVVEEKTIEVEPEGSKFVRQSKVGPLNDSVERKLHAKSEAGKRKAAKSIEESFPSTREGHNGNDKDIDDDDSDGESENKTSAFAKKRAGPPTSSLQERRTQVPCKIRCRLNVIIRTTLF
ncbi:hypothetical protein P3X46_013290 [Hevea brasiliensis]|uniref:Uncharacterized protein n=1 Tax=Hevea brasiliensis TaxID=3981 RepID=A0ABQ9M6Y4_HEVBR|nr:hypothetical protein P3X46_013290 [Hevea brasiliensis]